MLKTRRIILFSAKLIKLSDIFAYTEENYLEGVELADGRMLYSFDFWDDAVKARNINNLVATTERY